MEPSNRPRNLRRLLAEANLVEPLNKSTTVPDFEVSMGSEDVTTMKVTTLSFYDF